MSDRRDDYSSNRGDESPFAFFTTTELFSELSSRYESIILSASRSISTDGGSQEERLVLYAGGLTACIGLVTVASSRMMDIAGGRVAQIPLDDDGEPKGGSAI